MTQTANLVHGALAGLVATVPMTLTMWGARSAGLLGEPPPRKITRAAMEKASPELARDPDVLNAASLAVHFAFGAGMGSLYAALPQHAQRSRVTRGLLLGSGIWAASYMGWVPALGIMPRPSEDRPGRPMSMVLAHWVFGATLTTVYAALQRRALRQLQRRALPQLQRGELPQGA